MIFYNSTSGETYQQIFDDHLLTNKLAWMSYMDRKIYLSDNILVKQIDLLWQKG